MGPTHLAFSDDSGSHSNRFNSLTVCTLSVEFANEVAGEARRLLDESDVEEFKWEKLRSAKYRFAAQKLIGLVFQHLDSMRVDTIIWDNQDNRHSIAGRDDGENRVRMYYHLLGTTLSRRWPVEDSLWRWLPDEQSAVDWTTLWDCLRNKHHAKTADLFGANPGLEHVRLNRPIPSDSKSHELIQVADLFAGLGSFSWQEFDKYRTWDEQQKNASQGSLFAVSRQPAFAISSAELEKFVVLKHLKTKCREYKLPIAHSSAGGFSNHNPKATINFWRYRSRHQEDSAPRKVPAKKPRVSPSN